MNKRADKPKRKIPLTRDSNVTDAQMEKHLRENHAEISEKLQEARDSIARGDVAPLEPLPELLRRARKFHKSRTRQRAG